MAFLKNAVTFTRSFPKIFRYDSHFNRDFVSVHTLYSCTFDRRNSLLPYPVSTARH